MEAGAIEAVRGVNYVPSNAVDPTQMWLEFDAATIDTEPGFAEALGLNSLRGLSVMPVLFDDCRLPEPSAGEQVPEPRPGRARRAAPSQALTACWYGALPSDLTSIHFYVSPSREPDEALRVIESARSFGRPVILPFFGERGIGWYLWELMIGADQTRYQWPGAPPVADDVVFQGLLYPDRTRIASTRRS